MVTFKNADTQKTMLQVISDSTSFLNAETIENKMMCKGLFFVIVNANRSKLCLQYVPTK